jgi:hypothetical protein
MTLQSDSDTKILFLTAWQELESQHAAMSLPQLFLTVPVVKSLHGAAKNFFTHWQGFLGEKNLVPLREAQGP